MANITNGAPINANYVAKFATATSINNSVIYQSGTNIGIGTTTPAAKLDVAGIIQMTGFKLTVSPTAGYILTSDASGNGTWTAPGIGGSGTTNYLPKFTGANSVGISVVSESPGGNIGIGTTTPASKLDVNGTARFGGAAPASGVYIDSTGNVGIGIGSPAQKLDVNGNINITGSVQALQSMLALSGLTGRSSSAATPAGVFDNTAGGKILSGQASGLEKFSVDTSGNIMAAGTAQVTGFKISTGASNGYVMTSDPSGNATWQPPAGGGGIGGIGTANAFPKFTDPTTVGDSLVYEANGNIGIGTDTPQEELTLAQDSNIAIEMQIPSNITYGFQTSGGLPADDYYFILTASDGVGWTKATPEILVTLGSSDHTISLRWDAVVGAKSYRVYRALTPGGPYKYSETSLTNFDYTNDGLFTLTGTPPIVTTAYVNKISASGGSWFLGSVVGIGTTTPGWPLHIKGSSVNLLTLEGTAGYGYMSFYPLGTSSSGAWVGYGEGLAHMFNITNGIGDIAIVAPNININGVLNANQGIVNNSSQRWKANIQTIHSALQMILGLRGVSFDWKATGKHDIGLIAEEVGEIIPEIVTYEEDGKDARGLDYSRLVAVLIEAVKEQQEQIEELKDTVKLLLVDKSKTASLA